MTNLVVSSNMGKPEMDDTEVKLSEALANIATLEAELAAAGADLETILADHKAQAWRLDAMARRAEAAEATLALVLPSQDVYDAIDACRVLSGPDTDGCHTTKVQRVLVRTWLDDIRTYVGRVVR